MGRLAGSMDVAMNTHAVMLEKRYQRHIMSHSTPSSAGGMRSALGIGCFTCGSGRDSLLGQRIALAAMSILAFRWLPLPPALKTPRKCHPEARYVSVPLGALGSSCISIMLVEGAIADWSAIYLRTSFLTGPGLAALGYAVFSGAMLEVA